MLFKKHKNYIANLFMFSFLAIVLALGLTSGSSWAKESETPEVGLNEAISMAIKHSSTYEKALLDIDKSYENRQQASDQLKFTPVIGGAYDPRVEIAWYSLLSADLSWQMSKRNQDLEEDRLVIDTCQKYWNVIKASENVKLNDLKLKKAEKELDRVKALLKVGTSLPGLGPQLALSQSENAVIGAQAALAKAQAELNSAYENFNQLVGLWPNDRPVLIDHVQFVPVVEIDLDVHVQRVLETSPSVWLAEEGVNMAKYAEDLMRSSGQYKPYEVRKIEVKQAELDAKSIRDLIALSTREMYYNMLKMQEVYAVTNDAIKIAEENLRIAQISYQLGLVTSHDVLQKEVNLDEAEKNLLDCTIDFAYLKMAFQKPWAITPR